MTPDRTSEDIERALRQSIKDMEDLKYALDQSAIVAITDVQGDITYVNDKFCEISQYARTALIGQNHRLLNSGLHPTEFFRELYRTIANGRVWRGELRNKARDGSHYWVDTTIVPFLDEDGKPYQYVSIRYDITERKRSEAALRDQASLAQLGKMAAIVAHEVRNPLAGIRGALQVIGKRLGPQTQEFAVVQEVISRVDGLSEIVQDLLQFARPRQPMLAPVPVREFLEAAVSVVRRDPALAHVSIDVSADDSIVKGDAGQLQQALLNLLINGAQAMQGQGRLTVTATQETGTCTIRITDEGPGIPADVREHLFEPFFTTKHRGTGLGLATARKILDSNGGSLTLECPPGGGTTAVISVPLAPA
jgi:PAS domain S-box-containing protein